MGAHINVALSDDLDVRTATEQVTILADGTEVTFEGEVEDWQEFGRQAGVAS